MTYGDGAYGDPTPPEEPPMYDVEPFTTSAGQIVEEIRRLEKRERTFAEDLMAEAEAHNATRAERDTAVVRAEEAEEVASDLRAEIAELEWMRTDDRLTIADLRQKLHECEGEPEVDPIVVGGSHKHGWQALKDMIAPVMPGGFRQFCGAPRLAPGDLNVTRSVVADGAIPYVSVTKTEQGGNWIDDAVHNANGLVGVADYVGAIIPVHEPTQKMTGDEFVAMVSACLPVYRDLLPNWERLLCFMRWDFLDPTLSRHPNSYLRGFDWSLATGLAVDVYDKGRAHPHGFGFSFADLMIEAEAFALEHGLPIHVLEASAPDTGQYGRRAGWKPQWYEDAYEHMASSDIDYRTFLAYNSDRGKDSPPAVGDVKAGWWADTTPESLAAYIRCIERSRA